MIRKMQKSDKAVFLAMTEDFYNSRAVIHSVSAKVHERAFESMTGNGQYGQGYIFEVAGQVVGYALTSMSYSSEVGGLVLWIEEIYVMPDHRSEHIGTHFVEYVESINAGRIKRIRLEVEPTNTRAIELYNRLGFEHLPYYQMIKEF